MMHASRKRGAKKAAHGHRRVVLTAFVFLAVQAPPPRLDAATAAPTQLVARLRGGVDAVALAGGPWGGSAEH